MPALQQWLAGGAAPKNGSIAHLSSGSNPQTMVTGDFKNATIVSITTEPNARSRVEMTLGAVGPR